MAQSRSHIFLGFFTLVASVAVGCGDTADVFDFTERNTNVAADNADLETIWGAGGMLVGPEPFDIGGASAEYREGGYAGGEPVVDDNGNKTFRNQYELCSGVSPSTGNNIHALSFWNAETCQAGSLCSAHCTTNADCTIELPGPLATECRLIHEGSPQKACVLPCQTDSDCEEGMVCGQVSSVVKSCLLPDMPWAPGCTDFCMDESEDSREVICGRDAECCEGLSCSPNGECQARECLPAAWACSENGVACCEGLTCDSGYCSSP